jgi:D-arabinose 1-dehydrogenase-like Zn-dependent alcohol dehydrogenase
VRAYAVLREGDPSIGEVDLPAPPVTDHEVRLRVLQSGVCHSDVHLATGYHDLGTRGRVPLSSRGFTYPLVMGHEIVGVVEQVGPAVEGVGVGDVRLVYPWIGCGSCRRCAAGEDNLCATGRALGAHRPGGFAEAVLVPHERYLLDIAGLEPAAAATLACSGLTALAAVKKALPLPPDSPVVVVGVGGVGLTVVGALAALGHRAICAVDLDLDNLALARGLGATTTVQLTPGVTAADLLEQLDGPVEAVIDLVNSGATSSIATEIVVKGGLVVQVGLFGGELQLPTVLMPLRALTLRGSYVGTLAELQEAVELARSGALRQPPILPGVLDRAGVASALQRLAGGGVPGRIVLAPRSA